MAFPGRRDASSSYDHHKSNYEKLRDDLAFLENKGISAVVSLTEEPLNPDTLRKLGMDYLQLAVSDMSAPTLEDVEKFVDFVEEKEKEGKAVAVHCIAGIGRTGTMLACYLVKKGKSSIQAIQEIRHKRPGSVETEAQEQLVINYQSSLKDSDV